MCKGKRLIAPLFAFVLTLAVGVTLAAENAGSTSSTAKTPNHTTTGKNTMKPAAKSSVKKGSSQVLASAEDLSGTITRIGASDKEVTLIGSNGVPYDFKVISKTRVKVANKEIPAPDLANEINKPATVHFIPEANGNLAETILLSSS
jgi:hypothetical protein